jgi:hypothetical protein
MRMETKAPGSSYSASVREVPGSRGKLDRLLHQVAFRRGGYELLRATLSPYRVGGGQRLAGFLIKAAGPAWNRCALRKGGIRELVEAAPALMGTHFDGLLKGNRVYRNSVPLAMVWTSSG